ncbi:GNAT family N-acetyltransferase [Nocardioides sp.]|uniref:GNAT family N-acetyltransferase n=1 Tax=Nocardioides sp. TaxID=35761 RepID=UPI0035176A9A
MTDPAGLTWTEVEPDGAAARDVFERYVAELDAILPGGFAPGPVVPPSTVLLAMEGAEPVAGGGLQWLPDGTEGPEAEVKRMWVAPAWRGHGLGARLLAELEARAAAAGARTVRLDTHPALTGAIALYRRSGYAETPRYNANPHAGLFFAKRLDPARDPA